MSSVRNDFNPEAKITYMSTRPFNGDFWSYDLTYSQAQGKYIGTLSALSGATASNCPAKRFLHETGKKLFPSANPGIKTMLVGVYDPVTFLKGYIDPNSEAFLRMNNDRAANIDTLNPADNEANLRSIHGEFALRPTVDTIDYGQPVYTRGDIITTDCNIYAQSGFVEAYTNIFTDTGYVKAHTDVIADTGSVYAYSNVVASNGYVQAQTNVTAVTGNVTANAGNVIGAKQVFSSTVTPLSVSGGATSMDVSLGQTFTVASDTNFTLNATNLSGYAGAVVRCIISNPSGGSQISVTLGTPLRELYNGTGIATNLQTQTFTVTTQVALNDWTSYSAGPLTVNYASSGARNFDIPDNVTGIITFLCDGTSLLEMSRCLVNGN